MRNTTVLVRVRRGNVKGRGGGKGDFFVEHGVVDAAAGGDATCAQVNKEGEGGGYTIAKGVRNQLGA